MASTSHASLEPESLLAQLPFLRKLAGRLLDDPAAADDVAQDAVVAALERGSSVASTGPWLAGVTRNLARLLFRREQRRRDRQHAAAAPEKLPSAADESVRFEALRRVVLALDRLAPDERALLVRRFYDEWPPRRIAADLGVPVNTVRTRIARALARLRIELVGGKAGEERDRLHALLAPLLAPPVVSLLAPVAPIVAGGLLVSSKVKAALAVALVAAVTVCIAVWPTRDERTTAKATDARAAAGTAEPAMDVETQASRRDPLVAEAPSAARTTAPRGRRVALRGRLVAEAGSLARWSSELEVVAAVEVVSRGSVAARPAPERLRRAVKVEPDGTFTAELALDGDAPRLSRLTLRGADPAFLPFERRIALPAGTSDLLWNVEARLFETAVVVGHVVDAAGQPAPDGAVGAFAIRDGNAASLGETLVDQDGAFALGVAATGPCFVVATRRRRDLDLGELPPDATVGDPLLPVVVEATPTIGREVDVGDLVLRPGATIRGRVEWFAHGPVAGAIVSARPFEPTTPPTDENDIPPGTAFTAATLTRPVALPSGRLARAAVATDEHGEFALTGLPPGPTRVRLASFLRGMTAAGFVDRASQVVDAPAEDVELRFDGALVEFAVTSGGAPLAGARVHVGTRNVDWTATWNRGFDTGPEGLVEAVVPPDVDATWESYALGCGGGSSRFRTPAAGDRVRIAIELALVRKTPSVAVHVIDEAGAPVTTAGFQWEPARAAGSDAQREKRVISGAEPCASDGRFVLNDIAPGDYEMRVRPGGKYRAGDGCYAEIVRAITVRADRVDELELVAVAAGRLRAAARDASGRFLPARMVVQDEKGVEIGIMPIRREESESGEWLGESFHNGLLSMHAACQIDPPLAPGRYSATFTLAGYATQTVGFEIAPLAPCDLEVVLVPLR